MMKLVVLALCLFVAVAYAGPVFEEVTAPESARLPMGAERAHILRVPVAVPRARLSQRHLPRREHLLLLALNSV
ncbi:hypothetical protein EVAR_50471_1 [Eumeta japonica]|uniref:Uncharacterized protein n=1 Tax=Eumeta variegata TaxID=151549 RepID=A0A4C1XRR5_EUMVA|nr:hypothetical protein EVAR_50471_1 [Eumeta japonica]